MDLYKIDAEFRDVPRSLWDGVELKRNELSSVTALIVLNDVAEKEVKFTLDFLPKAKAEKKYLNVLQVDEDDRHN